MYFKVINDIINFYSQILNKEELNKLSNIIINIKELEDDKIEDDIIIYVNNILDRIWKNTLTNIKEYKNSEEFCFLVKDIDNVLVDLKYQVIEDANKSKIFLLNDKNILDYNIYFYGYIIELNYKDDVRTTPLLPIYFDKKSIDIKDSNFKIKGVYSLDIKLGDDYNAVKKISKLNNFPLILINKCFYREKNGLKVLTDEDINYIIFGLWYNFCCENKLNVFKVDKNGFVKDKNIKKLVLDFYNNKITLEEFNSKIKVIFYVIKKEIDLLDNKKKSVL